MMKVILTIPEMVDASISSLNQRIIGIENRITALDTKVNNIKVAAPGPATPGMPGAPPAPPGPPGAPPPPPRPGAPGAPPGPPQPQAPANPISLRSSIMDELKTLFAKRKGED